MGNGVGKWDAEWAAAEEGGSLAEEFSAELELLDAYPAQSAPPMAPGEALDREIASCISGMRDLVLAAREVRHLTVIHRLAVNAAGDPEAGTYRPAFKAEYERLAARDGPLVKAKQRLTALIADHGEDLAKLDLYRVVGDRLSPGDGP